MWIRDEPEIKPATPVAWHPTSPRRQPCGCQPCGQRGRGVGRGLTRTADAEGSPGRNASCRSYFRLAPKSHSVGDNQGSHNFDCLRTMKHLVTLRPSRSGWGTLRSEFSIKLFCRVEPRQWFAGGGEGDEVDSGDGGVGQDFSGGGFGRDAVEIQHGEGVSAVVCSAERHV